MGLFDTVRCQHPLPDPRHQGLEFQTKDLDCLLEHYTITRDGRLIRHARKGLFAGGPCRDIEWPIHGDLRMYEHVEGAGGQGEWVEYVVRFTHGRVEWIRPAPQRDAEPIGDESDVATEHSHVRVRLPPLEPCVVPAPEALPLTAEEFMAHSPEKLELVDGHVPGEEELLLLLLKSVGLRRAAALVGEHLWARALREKEP